MIVPLSKKLSDNKIRMIEWSSQSTALNPIENLWAVLKNEVSQRQFSNKAELWSFVKKNGKKLL